MLGGFQEECLEMPRFKVNWYKESKYITEIEAESMEKAREEVEELLEEAGSSAFCWDKCEISRVDQLD